MRRRPAATLLGLMSVAAIGAAPTPGVSQEVKPPRLTVTAVANGATTIVTGVSFPDPVHGFAVAADNSFFTTADGGQTWAAGRTPVPAVDVANLRTGSEGFGGFTDVDFTDPDRGHVVSLGDTVIATSDGGRSWVVQPTPRPSQVPVPWPLGVPTGWAFNAVSFVDREHGFVVGSPGVILATADGGTTWRYQGNPDYDRLTDVAFVDADHGHIVGKVTGPDDQTYLALATVDGGSHWTPQRSGRPDDSNVPVNFDAVAVTDPRHAVVAGSNGRIFVTFDGGKTWRNRRSGTEERLNSVAFADRRRGLAVGEINFQGELRAQILATNDGGQTWFPRPTPEAASLSEVAFADRTTAYVVGCATAVGSCKQGAILNVDFPELEEEIEQPTSSAFSPIPLVLLGVALLIAGGGIVLARRR